VNGTKTFKFTVNSAQLSSFAGAYLMQANNVNGTLTVAGYTVELHQLLEPDYTQAAFDDSYRCTPNLLEPVPVAG